MTSGTPALAGGEVLVRRFNPAEPSHAENVARDEGTGDPVLRGGAFRFDDDGCSVYRVGMLDELGIAMHAVATPQHPGLATAEVAAVRAVTSGLADTAPEFDVRASPLAPPPEYNPAHASIINPAGYGSKSKRRQAIKALAAQAFKVIVA